MLDLGCGTGRYLTKFGVAGTAPPVGVDFSLGMLRAARGRLGLGHLVCADLQRQDPSAPCQDLLYLLALPGRISRTPWAAPASSQLIVVVPGWQFYN